MFPPFAFTFIQETEDQSESSHKDHYGSNLGAYQRDDQHQTDDDEKKPRLQFYALASDCGTTWQPASLLRVPQPSR
jgi:hypothetical protein